MGRIKKSQRRTRAPFSWKRGGVATFAPNFSTAQEELGEGSEGARPGLPVWPWGVTPAARAHPSPHCGVQPSRGSLGVPSPQKPSGSKRLFGPRLEGGAHSPSRHTFAPRLCSSFLLQAGNDGSCSLPLQWRPGCHCLALDPEAVLAGQLVDPVLPAWTVNPPPGGELATFSAMRTRIHY